MDNNSDVDSRVVRVLVLLTLPNMQGEWDELKGMVFPELRRFCEERGVEFIELDPPWEATKSQMAQGEIYSHYMEMINQHRPYCIVLLGEDYTWTPVKLEYISPDDEAQGRSLFDRLITDGILNNPHMAERSFFYFRDPAYATREDSGFVDENHQAQQLDLLKGRICSSGLPVYEEYPDPKTAAQRIEQDLRGAIEVEYVKITLQTAADLSRNGDYTGAEEILRQALDVASDRKQLKNRLADVTIARIDQLLEQKLKANIEPNKVIDLLGRSINELQSIDQLAGPHHPALRDQIKRLEDLRKEVAINTSITAVNQTVKKVEAVLQEYKPGLNFQSTFSQLNEAQRALEQAAQQLPDNWQSDKRQIDNHINQIIAVKQDLASAKAAILHSEGVVLVNDAVKAINFQPKLVGGIDKIREAERFLAGAHGLDPSNDTITGNLAQVRQILHEWDRVNEKQPEKLENSEMPTSRVDQVHFTVTAPTEALSGEPIVINLWAHLQKQRNEPIRRAQQASGSEEILAQSVGPLPVMRGTVLRARLQIDGCQIDDPENTIRWQGEIGNATFAVIIPKQVRTGALLGKIYIYADTVQVARIDFRLRVGKQLRKVDTLPMQVSHHKKAFASYASGDREAVLARIQGMQKAAPNLEIFLDVLSLRSGQKWEQELWKIIPRSDVFYLFWSENASRSPWVEKEWRCALDKRGLDFIDPVPLVSPDLVPPPHELAGKHFNDWVLAFQRRS